MLWALWPLSLGSSKCLVILMRATTATLTVCCIKMTTFRTWQGYAHQVEKTILGQCHFPLIGPHSLPPLSVQTQAASQQNYFQDIFIKIINFYDLNATHRAQGNRYITFLVAFVSFLLCVHTIEIFTLESCNNTNIDFLFCLWKNNSPLRVILTLAFLSPIFTSQVNESWCWIQQKSILACYSSSEYYWEGLSTLGWCLPTLP